MKNLPATYKIFIQFIVCEKVRRNNKWIHFFRVHFLKRNRKSQKTEQSDMKDCTSFGKFVILVSVSSLSFCGSLNINSWEWGFGNRVSCLSFFCIVSLNVKKCFSNNILVEACVGVCALLLRGIQKYNWR